MREELRDPALLFEIHRGKISLHRKSRLQLPCNSIAAHVNSACRAIDEIFQTVHEGALAFLVVVSSACTPSESRPANYENASVSAKSSVFTRRRSPVRIRSSPSFFLQSATLKPGSLEIVNIRKRGEADKIGMGG